MSEMIGVSGDYCPGKTMFCKQSRLLERGRESLNDDERAGRPNDVTTHEIVVKVELAVIKIGRIKQKNDREGKNCQHF